MSDLATTKAILGDLIAHPSISADSNLPIIDDLANRLSDAGARVEVLNSETMPGKANLRLGPAIRLKWQSVTACSMGAAPAT